MTMPSIQSRIHDIMGFETAPKDTRVVVAMSGGVDSSVTAALLHEAGYDVIGITLQLYDQGEMAKKKGACCAGQDIYDASQVAEKFGFPHYVLDYESIFKQSVVEDFADSYLRGETPLPCVRCNQNVKFKDLLKAARDLDARALVTGHYVQRIIGEKGAELHAGDDIKKDQSYFLFATTGEQVDYLRFPLGGLSKEETRHEAQRLGLDVADKPDSQDICFVPNGKYADVVKKLRPGALDPGKIVHLDGRELGDHEGIISFTVGQRRGLHLGNLKAGEGPYYVVDIKPDTKEVIVGPYEALSKSEIFLEDVNWIHGKPKAEVSCEVKIRSTQPAQPATLEAVDSCRARIVLATPEYGISAGQACVFYQGSQVLGGGWIVKREK